MSTVQGRKMNSVTAAEGFRSMARRAPSLIGPDRRMGATHRAEVMGCTHPTVVVAGVAWAGSGHERRFVVRLTCRAARSTLRERHINSAVGRPSAHHREWRLATGSVAAVFGPGRRMGATHRAEVMGYTHPTVVVADVAWSGSGHERRFDGGLTWRAARSTLRERHTNSAVGWPSAHPREWRFATGRVAAFFGPGCRMGATHRAEVMGCTHPTVALSVYAGCPL